MCVDHLEILTSQKLSSPLRLFCLKSFHGFVILRDRIERITCLLFYFVIKMWKNLYKKQYQKWKTVKTFKKHQNVPTRTDKKSQIFFHRFLGECMLFLIPFHFWRRGNENPKSGDGIFHFNLLTISCHGNWNYF